MGRRRGHKSYPKDIIGTEGNDNINTNFASRVDGRGGDDTINSNVNRSSGYPPVYGGAGNDRMNVGYHFSMVDGGPGDDFMNITGGQRGAGIYGGDGNDTIRNGTGAGSYTGPDSSRVYGGKGDDFIEMSSFRSMIYGENGNDTIVNRPYSSYATLNGGSGDDIISLASGVRDNVIEYNTGDGNDTIIGFNDTSTLKIGDGKGDYSTMKSGSDIIVLVGDEKITLQGAASLSKVNISGQFIQINFDNSQNNTALVANYLDNNIENSGQNVTIQAQGGNDSINNGGSNVSINGGEGNDTIENNGSSVTIDGGEGNDSITNEGNKVTINGGAGNDSIYNNDKGDNVTIDGGEGNDSITNNSSNVTIDGGAGNDSVNNNGSSVTIVVGADNDSITNEGDKVTINGGEGNDLISLAASAKNNVIVYTNGDGNDVIQGFNSTSTLAIGGTYSTEKSDNDIIVTVGEGKLTLEGPASLSSVNIVETPFNIVNTEDNKKLTGGKLNDTIFNSGQNVTIQTQGGNDSIKNDGNNVSINGGAGRDSINNAGDNVTIDGGADNDIIDNSRVGSSLTIDGGDGNDLISNFSRYSSINGGAGDDEIQSGAKYVTIDGSDGKDTIENYTSLTTISGGSGDDSIKNEAPYVSIDGGAGNDFIRDYGRMNVTITGGTGDDTIISSGYLALFNYNAGDGNDLIQGFKSNSTLSIADNFSTEKSGNDIVVTVGEGKITLDRAASLQTVNIVQNLINVNNADDNKKLTGGNLNDTIFNRGQNVTIQAQGGDDYIWNNGKNATINGGAGDDEISNFASNVTINGNAGDDHILNLLAKSVTLNGGAGDDEINNLASNVTINGGGDNDTITNGNENVTIIGGSGDDSISLAASAKNNVIVYTNGDGNDTIQGFNETSTLEISGALHSTEKSGNDIIVTVVDDTITLEGAASLSSANIINSTYAIFTVKDSKVTATIPKSVEGDAYQFNKELNLLTLNDNLKECPVAVRNEDDSSVKVSGSYGSAELSGNSTLEYRLDGSKNNVTLTSKNYDDKISFREDAVFTYDEIQVDLLKGNVISTKGDKEISFDNNSSANIAAPEGAKININAGTFTINNLSINSTNGAGAITVEKDGLSFEGYGMQFVDLEVALESYFSKLAPMTVNYNSADKSYTIKNAAQVKTLSDDFTKLTLALGDDTQACFKVNGKEFLVANVADNLNVIEANGNTFKIQGKEIDTEKIGRVTIDEQLTFSGTEINFDGVKVNYAQNKPAIYSLDGKEISIDDAATVTTGDETKTITCAAGSYVINGKSFETSTDLTFIADASEIKIPLNDARTEIYFDGVKVSGVAGGEEIVFDLANDKISIPSDAMLNVTSPEEVKLNLAAGSFTIDGKTINTDNALEITADKDSIQVPLGDNPVTLDGAAITGTGAATIDNTDEYLYSILLPNGALVQNVSDNTFELHGKDSFAYFGDTNKKVELTEDSTAYIGYDKENGIYVGFNALMFEQVEIQGNDAWTVETSGTSGIDKVTGITSGATLTTSTEYVDAGDLRFEVETDGAGDFTICGEKFTATDKTTYVVSGNSSDEIKVSPLADEFKDDDSEAAGKIYQYDAAGDYTVNGITFHATENSKVQTITRGVEFDLSSGKFEYDGLTLEGSGTAQINRYNVGLISLTDGAKISGDESKYYNRQFEISGAVELGDKKFESNSSTRCILLNLSGTIEETSYTLNGFIVDGKFVEIQNDCYDSVKVVDKKVASIEGVKASAEIYGNGITNVSIVTTGSGEFLIRNKTYKISDDSDGVTFVTDSHGDISEINGLAGSVEGNFENEISINGKTVRLSGASSIKVTSDGENIKELSNVAGDLVTVDDKTYWKDVRVYELGGAEKLTTSTDGTIIFNGNKFDTSAGKTFELNTSGEVVGLENAPSNELVSANVAETDTENLATINLTTTDGLEEVIGDFSEGLTVNGVFVKVTDSTNFVVKNDEENIYIETTAADTFTINSKTFETYADKTIFKLDADGNVSEIVTDKFYLYPDENAYLIDGDFNDEIIFNGKKFRVTGTNDTSVFIGEETVIGVELAQNSVKVVESSDASEIAISGGGEITVGDNTFRTSDDFIGIADESSVENFIGTLSGKLGGIKLVDLTITTDEEFSVTSDGEKITALKNLQNGSFTCSDLNDVTINGAKVSVDNSEEVTLTITDGELTVSALANSANISSLDDKVNFMTKESGEFFIGEDDFKVTGDNSITFTSDESGKVNEISGLAKGASLQTAKGGSFVVNGATLTAKDNNTFVGLENSAKLDSTEEIFNKFIEDSDAVTVVSGKENITLTGSEAVIVEDISAEVNITAGKGEDTIYTLGKKVNIDLKAGGATKIFAAEGRATIENYDATTGAAFIVEENIAETIAEKSIAYDDGSLTVNSAQVTFADDAASKVINFVDTDGDLQKVGFVSDDSKLDASKESGNLILVGASNSTLTGGAGKNQIYLDENSESTILLNGRNTIENFNASFDGGDKLLVDATTADLKFDGANLTVKGNDARALIENISSEDGTARILTVADGKEIKTAIAQAGEIISSGDELADIYVGNKSGVDFTNFEESLAIDLTDGKSYRGINQITVGGGDASLWGGNGGDDLLVGGKAHNLFFYTSGNDTIQAANDGDAVILSNVTLEQISSTSITSSGVSINFNNGGSLTVDSTSDITYQLADGSQFSANHEQATWQTK